MKINNYYDLSLSEIEIEKKVHRDIVGGMWDEIGKLQFDFLIEHGLKASSQII